MFFSIGAIMMILAVIGGRTFDPNPFTLSWRDKFLWIPLMLLGSILASTSMLIYIWNNLP